MDDGETAPPAAKRRNQKKSAYIPKELVREILVRLPVESLMRFSCVCKAWGSTISGDASFHRAHLRLQRPLLLVSPQTTAVYGGVHMKKMILYGWDDNQQGTSTPLVHARVRAPTLSSPFRMHDFVHCDGLVLLGSTEAIVRVINPATGSVLSLPWGCRGAMQLHQAFGLGQDPRSHAYKVARCFVTGDKHYKTKMKVFTIGIDHCWRQTMTDPPYPVAARRTATFFKGSLIWTIHESTLGSPAPGFLSFRLDKEDFVLMEPPPCYPRLDYAKSALADLRGELCLACGGGDMMTLDMWMCDNMENPQWDLRYKIDVPPHMPPDFSPIASFGDQIVFKEQYLRTGHYDLKTKTYKNVLWMEDLRCHNPISGKTKYKERHFDNIDVIPFVPSLIPV
jgi:F-box interacting protein